MSAVKGSSFLDLTGGAGAGVAAAAAEAATGGTVVDVADWLNERRKRATLRMVILCGSCSAALKQKKMQETLPVQLGLRACCLLEGKDHSSVVKQLKLGKPPGMMPGLQLKRIMRKNHWDEYDAMFLVVNVEVLVEQCERYLKGIDTCVVVDASPHLDKPRVVTCGSALRRQIEIVLASLLHTATTTSFDLIGSADFDVALLGWLLGFPVVYFTCAEDGQTCLSNQHLHIIRVYLFRANKQRVLVCGFSVPATCWENADIQHSLQSAKHGWTTRDDMEWEEHVTVMQQVCL